MAKDFGAIKMQIKGSKQLDRFFKRAPEVTQRIAAEGLDAAASIIAGDARRNASSGATNALKDSIDFAVDERELEASIFTPVPYAPFVEFGTRPHMPPTQVGGSLWLWVRRVIGDPRALYPIARSIARKGTKAHPFMKPAADKNEAKVGQIFIRVLEEIEKALAV